MEMKFEYIFTDISKAFMSEAKKKFAKYSEYITFRLLNLEEDAVSQGFVPAYFDRIIASEVIHATKNVKKTLANIKILLKPGGTFDMLEQTRRNRYCTFIFGLLDGYWGMEDCDLRPCHCTLSLEEWLDILKMSGFEIKGIFPCMNQRHTFISSIRNPGDGKIIMNYGTANTNFTPLQEKHHTWIVFHEESSLTSKFLLKAIPHFANRNIIRVERGSKYRKITEENYTKYTIRPDFEKDFKALQKSINESQEIVLEGIVYCWSLLTEKTTQEDILKPFFYVSKTFLQNKGESTSSNSGLKFVALTKGVAAIEGNDHTNLFASTIWGFTKSLQNEQDEIEYICSCVDIGDNESDTCLWQIFYEIWNTKKQSQVAFKGNKRYVPKLSPLKPSANYLKLPNSQRFKLIGNNKHIDDFQFVSMEPISLSPGEIEVQVKTFALNFKDILNHLEPTKEFKNSSTLGLDFSGKIKRVHSSVTKWHIGDEVFGVNVTKSELSSHIIINEDSVLSVPIRMTLNEACTLPTVAATCYKSFIEVAQIKSTDVVLIHAASGGVGHIAIQFCQHVGALIIATAGTTRKRKYLESLGIQHVFNSRNTEYADHILKITNGKGVDVVLNSLTSEGFKEATLKACAIGARFVEISKLSIWNHDEVAQLRPDINYYIVDLSDISIEEWQHLMKKVNSYISKDVIGPIPYVRFDAVKIKDALAYMMKAKHIGKIVCVMPEQQNLDGKFEMQTPIFNFRSTYLITGGLGGIGFEVCKWMIKMGAKYVLLAGRKLPNKQRASEIAIINATTGSKIQAVQLNVASYEECQGLITSLIPVMGYPPLKGVMHAAGTLNGGLVKNWESLSSPFNAKVIGSWNLHEVTKNLNLEHFVLFSSVASLLGNPGHSNHSAGNHFEDTLAHYRHSIGLPATTINWGLWGEVGVATEIEFSGLKPLTTFHGICGLEEVLKSNRTQTLVGILDAPNMLEKVYPFISSYFVDMDNTQGYTVQTVINSENFWQQYSTKSSLDEKMDLMKDQVLIILQNVLNAKLEDIAKNPEFQKCGVDSMMLMEMKNSLQSILGNAVILSQNVVSNSTSVENLSKIIVNMIEKYRC